MRARSALGRNPPVARKKSDVGILFVLVGQVKAGAVGGAGVQVATCGGDRGVPKRLLDEVDGCAPVEAVARMDMAEPKGAPGFTLENSSDRR